MYSSSLHRFIACSFFFFLIWKLHSVTYAMNVLAYWWKLHVYVWSPVIFICVHVNITSVSACKTTKSHAEALTCSRVPCCWVTELAMTLMLAWAWAAATVSSSGLLWHLPTPWKRCQELRDLQSVACLGLSLPFHSTAGVRVSLLPLPVVINVVLIFQTLGSPFYLNLIKVA